ncbi:MAG: HlyD family secretion protein, partial [Chitinophagales bacterium]
MLPFILIGIIVVGVGYGIKEYIFSLHHETTDDAQVDGDISPVNARVSGYINEILFIENKPVSKGDTLVKIDDRDLVLKVQQAQAALDNAVANVAVVKANIVTSEASINSAQTNIDNAKVKVWKATQDYNRYESLLADKSITQAEFDQAKADKMSAETTLDATQKQLDVAKAQSLAADQQVSVAEAQVKARQADLDFAKLQLSYAVITAPSNGVTSKKNIQLGQLVQPGQTLFAVVTDTNSYIVANFKETQLEKMQIGQLVDVSIDAFPDEKITGKVYSFSGATG